MKFLTVRDLRNKSAQIWKELPAEHEMIVTNNGRPVAILSSTDEAHLEETLKAIRQARLADSISALQKHAIKKGSKITDEDISREIELARQDFKR